MIPGCQSYIIERVDENTVPGTQSCISEPRNQKANQLTSLITRDGPVEVARVDVNLTLANQSVMISLGQRCTCG